MLIYRLHDWPFGIPYSSNRFARRFRLPMVYGQNFVTFGIIMVTFLWNQWADINRLYLLVSLLQFFKSRLGRVPGRRHVCWHARNGTILVTQICAVGSILLPSSRRESGEAQFEICSSKRFVGLGLLAYLLCRPLYHNVGGRCPIHFRNGESNELERIHCRRCTLYRF